MEGSLVSMERRMWDSWKDREFRVFKLFTVLSARFSKSNSTDFLLLADLKKLTIPSSSFSYLVMDTIQKGRQRGEGNGGGQGRFSTGCLTMDIDR